MSKEEVIIAEAGNSGGQSNVVKQSAVFTTWEVLGLISFGFGVLLLAWLVVRKMKREFQKRIRREIVRSRDLLSSPASSNV